MCWDIGCKGSAKVLVKVTMMECILSEGGLEDITIAGLEQEVAWTWGTSKWSKSTSRA